MIDYHLGQKVSIYYVRLSRKIDFLLYPIQNEYRQPNPNKIGIVGNEENIWG